MKRFLSIIVVALMLVTLLPSNVAQAQGSPHFEVSSAQGTPGDQITVTVELKDSPGFGGMAYDVCYDNTVLKLVSYELGLGSNICTDSGMDAYPDKMNFQYAGTSNITGDGVLVSFVFEIICTSPCMTEIKVVPEDGTTFYYEGRKEVDFPLGTAAGNITVAMPSCSHTAKTEVPSKSADCVNSGNNLYYICDSCSLAFKADGVTETTAEDEMIPAWGHDLSDATCTEAAECQRDGCSHVEGAALGHSFTSYVSNNNATCTADGTKTAKCDRCEVTDTIADTGSAKGHDYADATCTSPKTCKVCGATEGDALGHSFTNYVSNDDATCTVDGTKTAKCDRCDVTDTVTDIGSAKGHDYADATCTSPKTCKVCGATEGDVLDHSFTNYVSNGDATCTADGTKTAKCDRCDVTDTITDIGSAKGHSYESTWSKGEDGHWHECGTCGDKTDFAAHHYGDQGDKCVICEYERTHVHRLTLVPAVDATCTETGNKAYYTCSGCENWFEDASGSVMISDKTSVILGALGHDLSVATCTEAAKCQREGCGHVEDTVLGHSFSNYVSNGDATCTEDGTKTAKCDRCDVTDTLIDDGSAKGHDYADATCTAPKTCKVCGATEGDPLGHSYATTWSKGEDGHWHECSACGDKTDFAAHDYGSDGDKCIICEYERAHIHRLTLVSAVDATCTADGNVAYYTCSGCENWFEDASGSVVISDKTAVVIAALGHDMTGATCTEASRCKREGCEYTEGSALGHDFADATCTAPKTCKTCGVTEGDPQRHSFTNYVSNNDATCTEDGTKTAKCDRCDVTDTATDVGSANGHDYADATCTAPKTCKVCGVTAGDPLGHSYATTWSKGEDGHWHECSACGDKTDFSAHDYGTTGDICLVCEYERTHIHELTLVPSVDATCTEGGNKAYYTCSGCENWFEDVAGSIVISDKTSVVVAALGHDMTEVTCTEAAYCQREDCDYTEGAALGHVDENADNKCDRCGASMGGGQPTTPDKPTDDVPQTGDISKSMMWAVVLILSIAGTIICVLFSKKKNVANRHT